jgi:hypothetical protein
VNVTAISATNPPAPYDHSSNFAPGTTAPDIAKYFAKKMKAAGYTVDYTDGSATLSVGDLTKIDAGKTKGRQVEIDIGGDTGVEKPPVADLPKPKDISCIRGVAPGSGYLMVYAAGVEWVNSGPATLVARIRISDVKIAYSTVDTAAMIAMRLQAAMVAEDWVASIPAPGVVRVTKNGFGLNAAAVSVTAEDRSEEENDDHWQLKFID